MRTVGIDLAAQPSKTCAAVIEWNDGRASVESLSLTVTDDRLVRLIKDADFSGIDCPFGWPDAFIRFVTEHRDGHLVPPAGEGSEWRRDLANRLTDLDVRVRTGLTPLSVSTDRIGVTAFRVAALLAELEGVGIGVDRSGRGQVVEVYPAAALKLWSLPYRGYKGGDAIGARRDLLAQLMTRAPWLDFGDFYEMCLASDDALDAVIAALIVRAHATRRAVGAPESLRETAAREGWIVLPTADLADLGATGQS